GNAGKGGTGQARGEGAVDPGRRVRARGDAHIREGKHGARSSKQAIAIGLSKARRAGVPLKALGKGQASARTRRSAKSALKHGRSAVARKAARTRARNAR